MKQQEVDMLDDEKLIWICVEPIVRRVRGKDPGIKSRVVMELSNGQRALFLFQVLYGHANHGVSPFFHQISYLMDTLDIWSALKSGIRYFDDAEMLGLIEKMEGTYYAVMDQNENTILIDELDRLYKKKVPETLKRIGLYIRSNLTEFMQVED